MDTEPELSPVGVEALRHFVKQFRDVGFVCRVDLFPIDHHARRFRALQMAQQHCEEMFLPFGRPMCEILDRFGLPGITDLVGQERHQRQPLGGGELGDANVGIDLQIPQPVGEREPFRADMSQFAGMLLERSVTIGIAIRIKAEPHFATGKFPRRGRRRRPERRRLFAGRGASSDKFLPERNVRRKLPSGILLLQRLQLSFQLAQSERDPQLRRHEKRLDKKDRGEKGDNAAKKKCQAQAWPSPPGRVGENKGSPLLGKISVHQAPRAHILARAQEMPKSDFSGE